MKAIIDKINGDIITVELENGNMLDIKHINNGLILKEGLCITIRNNIINGIDYNLTEQKLNINRRRLEKYKNR